MATDDAQPDVAATQPSLGSQLRTMAAHACYSSAKVDPIFEKAFQPNDAKANQKLLNNTLVLQALAAATGDRTIGALADKTNQEYLDEMQGKTRDAVQKEINAKLGSYPGGKIAGLKALGEKIKSAATRALSDEEIEQAGGLNKAIVKALDSSTDEPQKQYDQLLTGPKYAEGTLVSPSSASGPLPAGRGRSA